MLCPRLGSVVLQIFKSWFVDFDPVRAKLRLMVKAILKKYKDPPNGQATETVLEQAKELSAAWATL